WDAYPYTQFGTRIHTHNLGRVSTHTKLGRVSIHTNKTKQFTNKFIETTQIHKEFTKDSQKIIENIKIHRNHKKPHPQTTTTGWVTKNSQKIAIYIYIYIYTKKNHLHRKKLKIIKKKYTTNKKNT